MEIFVKVTPCRKTLTWLSNRKYNPLSNEEKVYKIEMPLINKCYSTEPITIVSKDEIELDKLLSRKERLLELLVQLLAELNEQ